MCDFAETYKIYDLESFSPEYIAILAAGLRHDSRIMMKLANINHTLSEIMLAKAVDNLSLLVWHNTRDGAKGINCPDLIAPVLAGESAGSPEPAGGYDTPEEFMRAYYGK